MKDILLNNLLNMDSEQNNLYWKPYSNDGRSNVEIISLYNERDENNKGPAAALLRYKAGAKVTRHLHQGYELIFVLSGVLCDDRGAHHPGTLEICPPGSTHELWSDDGCVFLVVWEQPVATNFENDKKLVSA